MHKRNKQTTKKQYCGEKSTQPGWIVVPLRPVRAERLRGHTRAAHREKRTDGVHSPDCEELDPNKRQARRKPKQHGAVVGFMFVLGKYLL